MPDPQAPLRLFGLEFVPPRWAISAVSAVVVIGVVALLYLKVGMPIAEERAGQTHQQEEMAHYQKHFGEPRQHEIPVYDSPELGSLTVGFYASDRCLVAIRKNPGAGAGAEYHFIREAQYAGPAPGPLKRMSAGGTIAPAALVVAVPAQVRRCLNPHPGQFQSWTGPERNGCWVAVWRRWPDGCTHYQYFNSCNGAWDINPNGSPRVYWTNCVH